MARKGKIKCSCCGDEKSAARDFYSSSSSLYRETGAYSACKDCVKDKYSNLLSKYNMDIKMAFRHLTIILDLYWDESLFDNCVNKSKEGKKDWFGEYIRLIVSNSKYKGKTSLDNIEMIDKLDEVKSLENTKSSDDKKNVPKKWARKWGKDLEYEVYEYLEDKYVEYAKFYSDKTPSQKTLLKQICKCEWRLDDAYCKDSDDSVKKYNDTLSKLMSDADIKPSSKNKIDDDDKLIFGKIMQIFEKKYPVIDRDRLYDDVDGIYSYIYKFFIKPFAIAQGYANGNYDVDDGDKNIEIDDDVNKVIEAAKNE